MPDNRTPKFVCSYAIHKINNISQNTLMNPKVKLAALDSIKRAVDLCERDIITVDEAMEYLLHPWKNYADATGKVTIPE